VNFSPAIAWSVPCLGIAAAVMFGRRKSNYESGSIAIPALALSVLLGVALTFVQVFLHSTCVEELHLCEYRGDGNMSYWFQSFFAIPVYWLASIITWKVTK
jgi:hypothetical protein